MPEKIRKMGPRRIDEPVASRNKKIVISVSVVALACLAVVLGLVFAGGGTKPESIKAQAENGTEQPTPISAPESAPTKAADSSGIEAVEVPPLSIYYRRNPFKPLVNMQEATLPTGTGTGTVTVPPELATGSSSAGQVVSRATTLEAVYEQDGRLLARVRIADQVFDGLAAGDVFASHYKLLSLGGDSSATILYGDERMKVYTGQSIYW